MRVAPSDDWCARHLDTEPAHPGGRSARSGLSGPLQRNDRGVKPLMDDFQPWIPVYVGHRQSQVQREIRRVAGYRVDGTASKALVCQSRFQQPSPDLALCYCDLWRRFVYPPYRRLGQDTPGHERPDHSLYRPRHCTPCAPGFRHASDDLRQRRPSLKREKAARRRSHVAEERIGRQTHTPVRDHSLTTFEPVKYIKPVVTQRHNLARYNHPNM